VKYEPRFVGSQSSPQNDILTETQRHFACG
jgi:hypothetical protein